MEVYPSTDNRTPAKEYAAPHHRRMILMESGIDPDVARERGYRTIADGSDIPPGFGKNQRRAPALEIPVYSPDGTTTFSRIRPDDPRPAYKRSGGRWITNGRVRYEQPKGQRIILDVHPRNAEKVKDTSVDLWVTEGEKKGDSLTSRGLCAVALFGVDCWGKGGELLADWQHVALNGRAVYIVFDADVMVKPEVHNALERLVGALEARGAVVNVVYMPGPTKDVDEYLVAGGTVEGLYGLARPFEKSQALELRLSKDERLRAAVEALWAKHDAIPTRTEKQCIRRAVVRAHIGALVDHGKPGEGGEVSYYLAAGEGAITANISQPTFTRHTRALEEEGVFKVIRPKDPSEANLYAVGYGNHNGRTRGQRKGSGKLRGESREDVSSLGLSSHRDSRTPQREYQGEIPEFRHSRVIVHWREDDLGRRICEVDPLLRLGFRRREVLVYLLAHGPTNKETLMGRFASEKATWRDFKRDLLGPMIDQFPIIHVGDSSVSLLEDWRAGVEQARGHGQEEKDLRYQRVNYEIRRAAFHQKDKNKAESVPEAPPLDDVRQHWSRHPEPCACRECSSRFGRVIGEHVEDCRCGACFKRRREGGVATTHNTHSRLSSKSLREAPAGVASPARDEEPTDDWRNHQLTCECIECTGPIPRYARVYKRGEVAV